MDQSFGALQAQPFEALWAQPFSPCGRRVGMRGAPAQRAAGSPFRMEKQAPAAPAPPPSLLRPHPSLLPQGEKGYVAQAWKSARRDVREGRKL